MVGPYLADTSIASSGSVVIDDQDDPRSRVPKKSESVSNGVAPRANLIQPTQPGHGWPKPRDWKLGAVPYDTDYGFSTAEADIVVVAHWRMLVPTWSIA